MTLGDHPTQTQRRSTRRTRIRVMGTSLLMVVLVGIGFGTMLCCVKADEPAVSATRNELQRQVAQREPSSTTNATQKLQQSSILTERQVALEPVTSVYMEHDDNLLGVPPPPPQAVSDSSRALDGVLGDEDDDMMVWDEDDALLWDDDDTMVSGDDFESVGDETWVWDDDFAFDDDSIEGDDREYHNVDDWEGLSSSKTKLRAKREKSRTKKSSSNEYNGHLRTFFFGLAVAVMALAFLSKVFSRSHSNTTTLRRRGQLGEIGMTSLTKSQTARV